MCQKIISCILEITMNYTEEQYSELYNNLPKGLRDLVLTGNLTTAVSALSMKYGLTPEETSELEPAVEDLALGLITPEELPENIFIQVGLEDTKAQAIASEVMQNIYGEYLEELRLTRKYKIEMDTKIRQAEAAQNSKAESESEVDVGSEKTKVAGNIINITKESDSQTISVDRAETDKKVADWFTSKKVSGRDALDALGDGAVIAPRVVPIQKTEPKTNNSGVVKATIQNVPPQTPSGAIIAKQPKSAWDEMISAKTNNLKPTTEPVISPSKVAPTTSQPKDFERSMVQVEQQILTLTQAVNKMIDQNSKTINPVVQSVFNSGQYEEVSRRMDAINHRIDDLQAKLITLVDQHKKDTVQVKQDHEDPSQVKGSVVPEQTESAVDRIIKIRKEEDPTHIPKPASTNSQSLNSTISKNALDNIFQVKKESAGNPIAITKQETVTVKAVEPTAAPNSIVPNTRSNARDQLLKDLEILKKGLGPEIAKVEDAKPTVEPSAAAAVNNLKEEIDPATNVDKMKSLQDKIKSLNKGITQGGIVSAGSVATDPYKL